MGLPKGLEPRIAELGKIKIGYLSETEKKAKSGRMWRPPVKLDRFLITRIDRDNTGRLIVDEELMNRLKAEYGDGGGDKKKLRQIPIYLLSDDIDECMQSRYVLYQGRRRAAYCDGETLTVFRGDSKLDEPESSPCTGEHKTNGWKVHTTLNCVIASGAARFGGVYKFRTTSIITTQQLYGGLLHIQSLTGGVLTGIPMRLIVRPMQVTPNDKTTTIFVCHIELHGTDLVEIQQKALQIAEYRAKHHRQIRAAQQQYAALLSAPGDGEDDDEQRDISDEFHPPQDDEIIDADVSENGAGHDPWIEPEERIDKSEEGIDEPEEPPLIEDDFDLPE